MILLQTNSLDYNCHCTARSVICLSELYLFFTGNNSKLRTSFKVGYTITHAFHSMEMDSQMVLALGLEL